MQGNFDAGINKTIAVINKYVIERDCLIDK